MTKQGNHSLSPKNILVRMPNWLGDLVMSTPVLANLCAHWPDARITAMCQSNVAALLKHDPHIDELYSYQRPSGWIPHQQHWNIIKTIRHGKYDLGVLLTNSFSSAWWFYLGKVRERIGYASDLRSLLLTTPVPFPQEIEKQHLVVTYQQLLNPLGIPVSDASPTLYITQEERDAAQKLMKSFGALVGKHILVGINPGAAYGSAKCWLPERFQQVTRRLLENPNLYVIYFGDPVGAPLVNTICKDMPSRVINLAGKTTIRELMACIKSCTVFLTNDSGPMHIAAALKTPLVALFGSTSDVKTGPSYGISTVIHKHVKCSPCYKRVCPIKGFPCMTDISVDEVYRALVASGAVHK